MVVWPQMASPPHLIHRAVSPLSHAEPWKAQPRAPQSTSASHQFFPSAPPRGGHVGCSKPDLPSQAGSVSQAPGRPREEPPRDVIPDPARWKDSWVPCCQLWRPHRLC